MVSTKLLNALLKGANNANKDSIIKELVRSLDYDYDYNNQKQNHILEMLVDDSSIVQPEGVDIDYIKDNISKFVYKAEIYNIKNITLKDIDNISCDVIIKYDYIEKINEDREDINYSIATIRINYIDNPEVLKKS